MGRAQNSSLLAGVRGNVGPVSVSGVKKQSIVRIRPGRKSKKKGSKSTPQQDILKVVGRFFRTLPAGFFKKGYQLSAKATCSPLHASTSYHMKHAVTGEYPNLSIDLSKVKFSDPRRAVENGWNAEFNSLGPEGLSINWEINPYPEKTTQLDDEAIIIFYNLKRNGFRYVEGILRSDYSYTFPAIPSNRGNDVACWIFFVSADKKLVSDTQYLGILRAETPEI